MTTPIRLIRFGQAKALTQGTGVLFPEDANPFLRQDQI
ncbi:hypothetical protein E1H18_1761 [Caulobacter sp. RHG1]|nr:hypothetical protein [Caulobacter sp. RHG1]